MKISGDPLRFCAAPPNGLRAVLLYGPNAALINESVATLKKYFFPAGADDFAIVTLNADELKAGSTRLADELSSFGFFAAKKLIHIKDAGDTVAKLAQEALALPDAGHFLVIESEPLGTRSALRLWAEKADNAASLPCYEFEGPALTRFVQAQFQKQELRITSDATALLLNRLGNDLALLPNVIAQLVDYAGPGAPQIAYEHVEALLVDQADLQMDALVQSIADSNAKDMDRILHTLVDSGTTIIGILRMVQNYFYRLRTVQAEMKTGVTQDAALAQLKPPLFFKAKPHFVRHLNRWPLERVDRVLAECLYLESQCKKTGTPEVALVQQRLWRIIGV